MTDDRKLSGSLDAISLPGLLQLLAAEGRSGRIELQGPGLSGSLWLDAGQLVHAQASGGETPEVAQEALDALLALVEGSIAFSAGEAAPARSLQGPTEHILMEAALRRDQARRGNAGSLPPPTSVPSFAPVPAGGSTPRFTTMQWRVLAAIDGAKSVETIAGEIELPVHALATILRELESAGVIQIT